MNRLLCFAFSALIGLPHMAAAQNDPIETYVATIRAGATDLVESSAFYRNHLGFKTLMDASEQGFVVLDNHDVMLVLTRAEQAVQITDEECFVAINFRTDDLEKTVASLEAGGIEIVAEEKSAVGKYVTILDPSGNRVHVKELFYDHQDGPAGDTPRVYNLGVRVTDIDEGIAFYEGILGFEIFSRDYYPPVIPMKKLGNVSFILSETASKPAPYDHRRVAFAGMAFEVKNVKEAMAALKERGVRFLDNEPSQAGNVAHAAFVDPFGNVHEIIQHLEPGETLKDVQSETEADKSIATLSDLAWISGVWRSKSDDDFSEETWSSVNGDAMVGMFRWSRDGKTTLYELMAIEQENDGIVFRLRHFSRNLTPWKSEAEGPLTYPLVSSSENEAVFEEPEKDEPRRFVYRRDGNALIIRIEGPDGKGSEFHMEREPE